jgi:cation diffusion facilitator CzcD-associated flavoprotein CzcO
VRMCPEPAKTADFGVIVVGAGFSGVSLLHHLRSQGISVRVLEAGSGVGGTWFWNRYPGARVDVESKSYSFTFSPELDQDWEWTERFPAQPEILSYINHVVDRFDLRDDIQLETRVVAADWDEDAALWRVRTEAGEELTARYCVFATGAISQRKLPDFPGLDSFAGETYLTSEWPEEEVDLSGKRVGVIGTGSTGIQVIYTVAPVVEHLTVFQRTPNFSVPAHNKPLEPGTQDEWKKTYPRFRDEQHASMFGTPDYPGAGERSIHTFTADELDEKLEDVWMRGAPFDLLAEFSDLLVDEEANRRVADFVRGKIRAVVDDPEVAARLSPSDYPLGVRRLCVDTNYYETFNRPNVELVDLREAPIEEIVPAGIRTAAGVHELDAIVFALGFDAITGALLAVDISGRDGVSLQELWADGPKEYLGLAIAGMPNLFTITGPGSPSVISNMTISIEQHVGWIASCIVAMERDEVRTIEPDPAAQEDWWGQVQEIANSTLLPKYDSWWTGANIAGKPRLFTPYLGGLVNYRRIIDEVADDGYRGFDLERSPLATGDRV